MSDLGLLSSVHGNFGEFADLVDETLAELQVGCRRGAATKKLQELFEEVVRASGDDASLQALVLESLLSRPTGAPLDDFADLARQLRDPALTQNVQHRLRRLSAHLEEERAALARRLRRG